MRRVPIAAAMAAAVIGSLVLTGDRAGAQGPTSGLNIAPVYEGWEQNADGSFNLVFGYMNRNWDETIDLPVGAGNAIQPGGPDHGQPTHFLPRRSQFVFRVPVPKDFGNSE